MRQHAGFTLVELLAVCSILAAVAYVAWGTYMNVDRQAEDELAHAQLLQLATALKRFHEDTGYYPGQGPLSLAPSAVNEADCMASDGILRGWAAPGNDIKRDAWFASPANLALLFDAPALCDKHPLAYLKKWNPETGRGWHGPYLDRSLRLWVDHGADLNGDPAASGAPDGTGTPLAGEKILDIPAYGVGPRYHAAGPSGGCANPAAATGNCMLGWRTVAREESGYRANEHELPRHARPFLLFGLANGDFPRVVYMGKDGIYGGRNLTDPCRPNLTAGGGVDDRVLCLTRDG
jgi:prepilin-type N-terminal cleavage/methylation domain-containing protein